MLYIFAGLPGSGKSTLAKRLSQKLSATYLRIDTIEQGLRDISGIEVTGEGYRLAYRIAKDNLLLGRCVVADSCNPITLTRNEWEGVARDSGSDFVHLEIICSDRSEHRIRVETRTAEVSGLRLPTWDDVVNREYHTWDRQRLIVDTSGITEYEALDQIIQIIETNRAEQADAGNRVNVVSDP